jgi:hypothetical protein
LAHFIRAACDVGQGGQKQRNPAPRAELRRPWYGFKANLAIAAQTGIATPLPKWVKGPEGRRAGCADLWEWDIGSDNIGHGCGGLHRLSYRRLLAEGCDVVGLELVMVIHENESIYIPIGAV